MNQEDYKRLLRKLLPLGLVWSEAEDSNLLKLLSARGARCEEIDGKGLDLVNELIPDTTDELLYEWELVCGLPDTCLGALGDYEQTASERRENVLAQLRASGSLSVQFLINVAANAGYTITIQEFSRFQAGSQAGDPLTNAGWDFVFDVTSDDFTAKHFTAGSKAGEPLVVYGNSTVRCLIEKFKPSGTIAAFNLMPD